VNEYIQSLLSDSSKNIVVLTGAGISAESGIPTFRGPEGYWTIGSKDYHPQEMATYAMFQQQPDEVWKWYLYRLSICRNAKPNDGHHALVKLEQKLGERFTLITQNIDNLHIRAGNTLERTLQIHGNITSMRCSEDCQSRLYLLPLDVFPREKEQPLSEQDKLLLRCPDCGDRTRPHVLWFDEYYDEHYFKYETALKKAEQTDLLIIAGTSGATTLPMHIATTVFQQDKSIIDINIEENPFSELAKKSFQGEFIHSSCSIGLTQILEGID